MSLDGLLEFSGDQIEIEGEMTYLSRSLNRSRNSYAFWMASLASGLDSRFEFSSSG
jgi:hypothetical protein